MWEKIYSEGRPEEAHKNSHWRKPFACLSCDRSFARKDYLLKHEKTHNKINGETNSTKGDHGAMKSRPETETLSQESVIINVSDLRSFVSESGDNMQVVRILGEEESSGATEVQSGYPLSIQDSVMYVITNG